MKPAPAPGERCYCTETYLHTAETLLARPTFQGVLVAGESPEYRLSWGNEHSWELTELPRAISAKGGESRAAKGGEGRAAKGGEGRAAKGGEGGEGRAAKGRAKGQVKTRLRQAYLKGFLTENSICPSNVLRQLSAEDLASYDTIKAAIHREIVKASLEAGLPSYTRQDWSERRVHYLKVAPADAKPLLIDGVDFSIASSWTEFHSYSPDSDLRSMDPCYTVIESSSATAARLLYKALSADPKALELVTWHELRAWLKARGIRYELHFSQWT